MTKNFLFEYARVSLVSLAAVLVFSRLDAQSSSTVGDGYELLYDGRELSLLDNAKKTEMMRALDAVGPGKRRVFRFAEKNKELRCELSRTPRVGEHIRVWFMARASVDSGLEFGLSSSGVAGEENHGAIRLLPEGRIAIARGGRIEDVPEFKYKEGAWQNYAIDHVVGSSTLLLTAGKHQTAISMSHENKSLGQSSLIGREGFYLKSIGNGGDLDVCGLEVYAVLEESIKALPVFGSIKWELMKIPYVGDGPDEGISGHGFVASGKKLYLMGGFISGGDATGEDGYRTSKWTHSYDPQVGTWTRLSDMPGRSEYGNASVDDRGVVYFYGGATQGKPHYKPLANVYSLDVNSYGPKWRELPAMPTARTHIAGGIVDDKLIVVGGNEYDIKAKGYGPSTLRKVTEILDLKDIDRGWYAGTHFPGPACAWTASASVKNKLYVFGGITFEPLKSDGSGKKSVRLGKAWAYDLWTDSWSEVAPLPYSVGGWRAAVYRDRYVILVGGLSKSDYARADRWNSQPLVYDTVENTWMRFADSATPPGGVYNDPGVAVIGDVIYVSGAEATAGHYNYLLKGRMEIVE